MAGIAPVNTLVFNPADYINTSATAQTKTGALILGSSDPGGSDLLRVGGNVAVGGGADPFSRSPGRSLGVVATSGNAGFYVNAPTGAVAEAAWGVNATRYGQIACSSSNFVLSGFSSATLALGYAGTGYWTVTASGDLSGDAAAKLLVNNPTDATSTTSAALIISGGIGWGATKTSYGGGLLLVSPTIGLGYATGAGGTVTQSTSKSTSVTLNKVCGTITMNAASLPATSSVSFTLTNSTIAATDLIVVNIKSGATVSSYDTHVESVSAGSCVISLRNHTLGALAEAVVLSFAVIKAVAA